ncbi:MAG TPA: RluA family pseudouridine synthase [Polyangiaceae bacterium]|nr:RluA family pseudouridine synthase [Polyangiaceae bacterium]
MIPEALGAQPLARALRTLLGGASWNTVRRTITTGKVRLDGAPVVEVTRTVRAGQRLELVPTAPRPSAPRLAAEKLVHVDAHVVVVEKPPHVSTVPYDDTERDTLDALVERELSRRERGRRGPLGVVHRLDKETSGLLVFARTLAAKRHLKNQFRFHTVARRYWALVSGHLESRTLRSRLVADRGDGRRGSTENPRLGRPAVTHVRALERLSDATLVECRLETGRTHQIRIHLSEAGHPLLGERVYVRGHEPPSIAVPRVMLHAFELGFVHPASGAELHFESPMPADLRAVLARLRG